MSLRRLNEVQSHRLHPLHPSSPTSVPYFVCSELGSIFTVYYNLYSTGLVLPLSLNLF